MPVFTFNNIAFTGKLTFVPTIKGATFAVSQYARMTKSATGDLYGTSMAATAAEMVVGAIGPNTPATGTGKLYVYSRNGDDWVDVTTITGPSTDKIGQSVDITGEWIAAGATNNGTTSGAVYMYRKVNGVWGTTPFQVLTNTSDSGIGYGTSVSLRGNELAVGHTGANSLLGAVQTWAFNGTSWSRTATISVAGTNGQRMGWSVYLTDNMVVAGGPQSATAVGNGLVMISNRASNGAGWETPTTIVPITGASGTGFGSSVVVNNGKIFAGAANSNAVLVFAKIGATWSQTDRLDVGAQGMITDTTANANSARVGWSLSVNAGGTVVVAGGYNSVSLTGVAYVFENVDGTWGPSAVNNGGFSRILPSPATTAQRFGWSQTMSGNLLVIGATGNGTSIAGAAYTFK